MNIPIFLGVCSLLLGGCSPLLSPETVHQLSHVYVEPIPERSGHILRKLLMTEYPSCKRAKYYALKVSLSENLRTMELGTDAKSNLVHVSLTATYEIKHMLTGTIIDKGYVKAHSSKNLTTSYYSRTISDSYILNNNLLQIQRLLLYRIAKALSPERWECKCPPQEG